MSPAVLHIFVLLYLFQPSDGPVQALAKPLSTAEACETAAARLVKAGLPSGIDATLVRCVQITVTQQPVKQTP